jgi:hypothetical protein
MSLTISCSHESGSTSSTRIPRWRATPACRTGSRAYEHAVVLGFTDGDAIARFLRYEASAPNFYRQPAIDAWLKTPGQPVEQRFAEVLARVKSRLRRD